MEDNRYPKMVYVMLLREHKNGKSNWVTRIENTLSTNGFREVWENQSVAGRSAFLTNLKNKLVHRISQQWQVQINQSERFSLYRLVKQSLNSEGYTSYLDKKFQRDLFVRFRFGISDIDVHIFRYNVNSDLLAICPFCPGVKEDERHFLCIYPTYDSLRDYYLSDYLCPTSTDSRHCLVSLLCAQDKRAT